MERKSCARWVGLAVLLACLTPASVASDHPILGVASSIGGNTVANHGVP
jgi:hypothetical protein